jgi:hypothetical protein
MVAANPNNRIQSAGSNPVPSVNGLVEREIYFHEQRVTEDAIGATHRVSEGANAWPSTSERGLRIHAWLIDRLLLLQEEKLKQHNLWHKPRRFLSDNRLGRWLGL